MKYNKCLDVNHKTQFYEVYDPTMDRACKTDSNVKLILV